MKKAYTIVELLTSCALIAILAGIAFVAYNNIRSQAQTVAQNRDQVVLQQVMESFRMMGGNMSAILALNAQSDQASALTLVLQKAASSSARKELGQIGSLLKSDMVIVPYNIDDGKSRLVANAGKTSLQVAKSGAGFIVTSASSMTVQMEVSDLAHQAADSVSNPQSVKGSKYANGTSSSNQYVWNEDQTVKAAPVSVSSNGTGVVTAAANTSLKVQYAFDNADSSSGSSASYTYHLYKFGASRPLVHILISRTDGVTLAAGDVGLTGITLTDTTSSVSKAVTLSQGSAGGKLDFSFDPSDLFPGNPQLSTLQSFALTGSVAPSSAGINNKITGSPIAVAGTVNVTATPATLNITFTPPANLDLVAYNAATSIPVSIARSDGAPLSAGDIAASVTMINGSTVTAPLSLIGSGASLTGTFSLPDLLAASAWTTSSSSLTVSISPIVGSPGTVGAADREALKVGAPFTSAATLAASPLPLAPPGITPTPDPVAKAGDKISIVPTPQYIGTDGLPYNIPSGGFGSTIWDIGIGSGWTVSPSLPGFITPSVSVGTPVKDQITLLHN